MGLRILMILFGLIPLRIGNVFVRVPVTLNFIVLCLLIGTGLKMRRF